MHIKGLAQWPLQSNALYMPCVANFYDLYIYLLIHSSSHCLYSI